MNGPKSTTPPPATTSGTATNSTNANPKHEKPEADINFSTLIAQTSTLFHSYCSSSTMSQPANTQQSSMLPPPKLIANLPPELKNLFAGGIAGMLAKTLVAPIDRIKILYQVTNIPFHLRHIPNVVVRIVEEEGLGALWRGNVATMVRVFPYAGIQFMVYNRCKSYFYDHRQYYESHGDIFTTSISSISTSRESSSSDENNQTSAEPWGMTPLQSLISGSCAGAISVIFTYPLDLTRAQLAVLKRSRSNKGATGGDEKGIMKGRRFFKVHGFVDVLSGNYRNGGINGLFRGIMPTILGILPYSGIAFSINEQAKRYVSKITNREPNTIEKVQCGALSGLVAQSVTYPLEVTRRRMQTIGVVPTSSKEASFSVISQGTSEHVKPISSSPPSSSQQRTPPTMLRTIKFVMEEQGMRGFFKGLSMNWIKGPVSFSISFTTFDLLQDWMLHSPMNEGRH